MYKILRVPGYNCPNKYLLMKDGEPIMFANGKERLNLCMQYLEGYEVDLKDEKIKRVLKSLRGK